LTQSSFSELGLIEPILRALRAKNYTAPTPIQARAIPQLLDGRDLLGIAQTGTGKTAAFALPILQQLSEAEGHTSRRGPRALILAPTRELAIQIGEEIRAYGRYLALHHTVIYGGVGQRPQVQTLARGVDIVIATPGRLLDLMSQRRLRLDAVEHLVLDEADRMLDMGFIRDVRKIVAAVPERRQTLFFSATMPRDVVKLAHEILADPARVEITPAATPVERITQRVLFVAAADKRSLLTEVLKEPAFSRVLVFTRTKHGADRVAKHLTRAGIRADAIHGNKAQGARQAALKRFRAGQVRVLVATDIAARGIDVDNVTHVINFELPNMPESYVHRIGRTARAGAAGAAISFCDDSEREYLRDIEKATSRRLEVIDDHPYHCARAAAPVIPLHRGKGGKGKPGSSKPSNAKPGHAKSGPSKSNNAKRRRRFRGGGPRRAA
jgi:ATP-dependent RNA helicase RhlE